MIIKGCFDNISHEWVSTNVIMDKRILKQFLKTGYIFKNNLYPTKAGTPQGGLCEALHKPPYAK